MKKVINFLKVNKYNLLTMILVFIMCVLLTGSSNRYSIANVLVYNTDSELPLSSISENLHVTLIDSAGKVVNTTNPDIEVDDDYKIVNNEVTTRVNYDDMYYLLFEVADTNNEKEVTSRIKENQIYSLTLPSYIKPSSYYTDTSCDSFYHNNSVTACGGIYKENDKYKFKVVFNNINNQIDIDFNYQFGMKVDKYLYDNSIDNWTFDFGAFGQLVLYLDLKPEEVDTTFITNSVNKGATSTTEKYYNIESTITDNQTTKSIKGRQEIILSNGALSSAADGSFDISLYGDNNEYSLTYDEDNFKYYYSVGDVNVIEIYLADAMYDSVYGSTSNSKAYHRLIIDYGVNGNPIEGVTNWKVVYKVGVYDKSLNANSQFTVYNNYKNYNDKLYSSNKQVNLSYNLATNTSYEYVSSSTSKVYKNLYYDLSFNSSDLIFTLDFNPEYDNKTGIVYGLAQKVFHPSTSTLGVDDDFRVYINDTLHTFTFGNSCGSFADGVDGAKDAIAYFKTLDYEIDMTYANCSLTYYKSSVPNADGEDYYIIIEKEDVLGSNSFYHPNYGVLDSKLIPSNPGWKMHFVNFSNEDVRIRYREDYLYASYDGRNTAPIKYRKSQVTFKDDYNKNGTSIYATYVDSSDRNPLTNEITFLEYNNIKIDANIDFSRLYNMNQPTSISGATYHDLYIDRYVSDPSASIYQTYYFYGSGYKRAILADSYLNSGISSSIPYIESNDGLYVCNNVSNNHECLNYYRDYSVDIYNSIDNSEYSTLRGIINDKYSLSNYGVYENSMPLSESTSSNNQNRLFSYIRQFDLNQVGDNTTIYNEFSGQATPYQSHMAYNLIQKSQFPRFKNISFNGSDIIGNSNGKSIVANSLGVNFIPTNTSSSYNNYTLNHFDDITVPLYNGIYQFTADMKSLNNNGNSLARNTKLNSVRADVYAYNSPIRTLYLELSSTSKDSDGFYIRCLSDDLCLKVKYKYDDSCYDPDYAPERCTEDKENMYYGISVAVSGLKNATSINFIYNTEVDNSGLSNVINNTTGNVTIDGSNNIKVHDWNYYDTNTGDRYTPAYSASINFNYTLYAKLTVEKSVYGQELSTNIAEDTRHLATTATIGGSGAQYLDITEFIDGYKEKLQESESNVIEDLGTLSQLVDYVTVDNLIIQKTSGNDGQSDIIYEDGEFISDYSSSTITFKPGLSDLFTVHIVPNSGSIGTMDKYTILYDIVFDIGKGNGTFRNSDIYHGGMIYLSVNSKGVRDYSVSNNNGLSNNGLLGTQSARLDLLTANAFPSVIGENTLTVYANANSGVTGAFYLKEFSISKDKVSSNGYDSSWEVTYSMNSTGKNYNLDIDLTDHVDFDLVTTSNYKDEIKGLLSDYLVYKNVKLYKNDTLIFSKDGALTDDLVNDIQVISNGFIIGVSGRDVDDVYKVTYDVDILYEDFVEKGIELNLLNKDITIKDTGEKLEITYVNTAGSLGYQKNSSINSVELYLKSPSIDKKITNQNNDITTWSIDFNTGLLNEDTTISDRLNIIGNISNVLEKSLKYKDFKIKFNNVEVYSDGEYVSTYTVDDFIVTFDGLDFDIVILNDDINTSNTKVNITYSSYIDSNLYNSNGGASNGQFVLTNTSKLIKGNIEVEDSAETDFVDFEFPLNLTKTYLGNGDNLHTSKYKILLETGNVTRNGIKISDINDLTTNYSKYLHIKEMTISLKDKNDDVVSSYDSKTNTNTFSNLAIKDKDNKNFVFDKNGIYDFIIEIESLPADSELEINYTLEIDKEEYVSDFEIEDIRLVDNNTVKVNTVENIELTASSTGYFKVESLINKKYTYKGTNSSNIPIVEWKIDINLNTLGKDLSTSNVFVEDKLDQQLLFDESTLKIYKKNTSVSSNPVIGEELSSSNYTYTINDDNELKITILNPDVNNNLEIKFETEVHASTNNLINSTTINVDDYQKTVDSEGIPKIITKFASGVITSNEIQVLSIVGSKYLDDKLSSEIFDFDIYEVTEDNNIIPDGYHSTASNESDGSITFDPIKFGAEKSYYYRVVEKTGNKKYTYDTNQYLIKVDVRLINKKYVVTKAEFLNSEKTTLDFYNKVKTDVDNPKTGQKKYIIYALFILVLALGIYYSNKNSVFKKL